jgi:hypothetical protein
LTSDCRLKENISPYSISISEYQKIKPVTFHWNAKSKEVDRYNEGVDLGFIAQDLEKIVPYVVGTDTTENCYKSIAYNKMTAVNTSMINCLINKIECLENCIHKLEFNK